MDQPVKTADAATRHDQINDRNYGNLWFYSNPVYVEVKGSTEVAGVKADRRQGDDRRYARGR